MNMNIKDDVTDKKSLNKCVMCNKKFESKRSDARFCSALCRMHHMRIEKRKTRTVTDINHGFYLPGLPETLLNYIPAMDEIF